MIRLLVTSVILSWVLISLPVHSNEQKRFKMELSQSGVYRVDFDELENAGLSTQVSSHALTLSNDGHPINFWIDDHGDNIFGTGDHITFIGQPATGNNQHHHEYNSANVYWLTVDSNQTTHAPTEIRTSTSDSPHCCAILGSKYHVEEDLVYAPLNSSVEGEEKEFWYWTKLSNLSQAPFIHQFDTSDMVSDPADTGLSLKLAFLGWSDPQTAVVEQPDHIVNVALNDVLIGQAHWDDKQRFIIELDNIPASAIQAGQNQLSLQIDQRQDQQAIIDIVYLDWIEISYQRDHAIASESGQTRIEVLEANTKTTARLTSQADQLSVFFDNGKALQLTPQPTEDKPSHQYAVDIQADQPAFWVVENSTYLKPNQIEFHLEPNLLTETKRVDYLMISHPSLLQAIKPLADFHRQRGLSVEVINVESIYDEFNHGLMHPQAIHRFLQHVYSTRQSPRIRWVLLVGDASWLNQPANIEQSTSRNLIPSWQIITRHGPAASDDGYAQLTDKINGPHIAIGRMPVATPQELTGIVNKTIAYMDSPVLGPWRSKALVIGDQQPSHKLRNQALIDHVSDSGIVVQDFSSDQLTNQQRFSELRQAFDEGHLLMHFYGHGGRYMWQVGSGDVEETEAYFDLEQLDQLAPNRHWPMVLSLTCNTGPFDHPNADSFAEKLLRMPEQGAIAVLAASSRNSPQKKFSKALLDEALKPNTIGQMIMSVKQHHVSPSLSPLYNLFGDPALSLALPKHQVSLSIQDDTTTLTGYIDIQGFHGHVAVEWLNTSGQVIHSTQLNMTEQRFELAIPTLTNATPAKAKVYAWSEALNTDAIGQLIIGEH